MKTRNPSQYNPTPALVLDIPEAYRFTIDGQFESAVMSRARELARKMQCQLQIVDTDNNILATVKEA